MTEKLARRFFVRHAAAAGAGLYGGRPAIAVEQDPPSPTDHIFEMLKARFPDRLTDDEWKQVRGKVDAQLAAAKSLGEFKLANSDEPATVFAASQKGVGSRQ